MRKQINSEPLLAFKEKVTSTSKLRNHTYLYIQLFNILHIYFEDCARVSASDIIRHHPALGLPYMCRRCWPTSLWLVKKRCQTNNSTGHESNTSWFETASIPILFFWWLNRSWSMWLQMWISQGMKFFS